MCAFHEVSSRDSSSLFEKILCTTICGCKEGSHLTGDAVDKMLPGDRTGADPGPFSGIQTGLLDSFKLLFHRAKYFVLLVPLNGRGRPIAVSGRGAA